MFRPAYRAVRATIINAILATDMAIHFDRSKDLDQRETRAPFDSIKVSIGPQFDVHI